MRIFFFLCIGVVGFLLPWWCLFLAVVAYTLCYRALEVVVWGIIFDVSFGIHAGVIPFPCLYGLAALVIVFVAEFVKPFLRFTSRA